MDKDEQSDRSREKKSLYRTHLANGKMTETTDEPALVQRVGRLLRATHRDHVRVHFEEAFFGDLDVKGGGVGVMSSK